MVGACATISPSRSVCCSKPGVRYRRDKPLCRCRDCRARSARPFVRATGGEQCRGNKQRPPALTRSVGTAGGRRVAVHDSWRSSQETTRRDKSIPVCCATSPPTRRRSAAGALIMVCKVTTSVARRACATAGGLGSHSGGPSRFPFRPSCS
jgi:hypothetical protein